MPRGTPKKYAPISPLASPRYGEVPTFSRLPHTRDLSGVDAAIVGVPFDGGTTYRPGARFGPRAIRIASCLNRSYHATHHVHIYEKLSVVDAGDIACNPLNLKKTFTSIETEYERLLSVGVLPIALGGDHSILLPILRALRQRHGRFGLIQFDAHADTAEQAWGETIHHGTAIRRLIEEGILRGSDVFQVGIRGPLTSAEQLAWDRRQRITQLTCEKFQNSGMTPVLRKLDRRIPYYLTFDIDGVDPAFAPATGTPVVGGLTSLQALEAVRALRGLRFLGFDVVEVAPAYDHAEITALLASALVFEFLALAALRPRLPRALR